jgi:hypothetical protein
MRNRIKQRMLRRIALAFAVAAVAAPTAQAVPLEQGSTKAEQSTFNPGVIHMPRVTPTDYAIARGDRIELARLNGRGEDSRLRGLDGVENVRVVAHGNSRALDPIEVIRTEPRGTSEPVLTASPSSFDWGDAGVGAGLSFAAILLAAAAALSVRQYGRLGQV